MVRKLYEAHGRCAGQTLADSASPLAARWAPVFFFAAAVYIVHIGVWALPVLPLPRNLYGFQEAMCSEMALCLNGGCKASPLRAELWGA